ncbi:MAG TPA: cytidine deaminase [Actinomycetes bacterium]|nr:cytidine deaminase [Actinomycetes bacterium]
MGAPEEGGAAAAGLDAEALVAAARAARARAYAPYSGFAVGAALLTEDGTVVPGANVENASYGLSICAERAAVAAAVAQGHRRFVAVAVAGPGTDPVPPCGACRQVLLELPAGRALVVLAAGERGGRRLRARLDQLLPHGFGAELPA